MRLADYLMTKVVPLAELKPEAAPKRQYQRRGSSALRPANDIKHEKTVVLYKSVVREEWTTTTDFENRLGKSRSTALPVLKRWEQLGIIESRPIDGSSFNRRKGLEWRFK